MDLKRNDVSKGRVIAESTCFLGPTKWYIFKIKTWNTYALSDLVEQIPPGRENLCAIQGFKRDN